MCILYIFSITIIRDSLFSLSLHMVSEPREKKNPNYFSFIRESILGNLSVTAFHSGHPSHLLKLSAQPYRRQKTLTAVRNPHRRRLFRRPFSGEVIFRHRPYHQVRKEIFKFSQSTGGKISATHRPRTFLLRRPKSHAPVREGAWSTFWSRASTSNLA